MHSIPIRVADSQGYLKESSRIDCEEDRAALVTYVPDFSYNYESSSVLVYMAWLEYIGLRIKWRFRQSD